jgi:spore coat protein A, manganese oxidase
MGKTNRRDFLERIIATVPGFVLANAVARSQMAAPAAIQSRIPPPPTLDRYIDPLPIPKRLAPSGKSKGRTLYRVRMLEFKKPLHSQLPPARLWGYEGQHPGPIIEAVRGEPIEVRWENQLPTQHIFPIDPHIHGAMPPAPAVRTVPHLHGARSASESDGLPEKWFAPGSSANYSYPNSQPAATLWYHDHAVGITRLNVYAGLSGFFLLRDEDERKLDLPSGDYEIPLLVQDRTVDEKGQLVYAPSFESGEEPPPGVWAPEFFGQLPVINGGVYPYLEVEPRPHRLRLLNGSNARFFNFYFNLAKRATDIPWIVSFHQIGSDGGLLPKPAELKSLLLAPAERADLILDFSAFEGKTVTLSNNAASPYPGWEFSMVQHVPLYELMQFRVTRPLTGARKAFSIPVLPAFTGLDQTAAVTTRDFVLSETMDAQGHSLGVRINGKGYDEPVTEIVKLGTTEKWRFINTTDDAHPMHLHLVQFQILERQGYNVVAFQKGNIELVGKVRLPAANEAGWKDTAVVNPRDVLIILVRFEGYTGRYVFHCHMLEHEDNDMMRPYEVVGGPVDELAKPAGKE